MAVLSRLGTDELVPDPAQIDATGDTCAQPPNEPRYQDGAKDKQHNLQTVATGPSAEVRQRLDRLNVHSSPATSEESHPVGPPISLEWSSSARIPASTVLRFNGPLLIARSTTRVRRDADFEVLPLAYSAELRKSLISAASGPGGTKNLRAETVARHRPFRLRAGRVLAA